MLKTFRDLLRRAGSAAFGSGGSTFRRLLEHGDQVCWLTDARAGALLYVSPSYVRLFGQSCQSLHVDPLAWTRDIHPDERDRIERVAAQVADGGLPAEEEYRLVRTDGGVVWVRQRFIPIANARGRVVRQAVIAEDVTRWRCVEADLRAGNERLQWALEGADLGLWDWNVVDGSVTFNERWASMLGLALDDIEPHFDAWKALVHPEDKERVLTLLDDHLAGRTPAWQAEHRLRHRSGEWVWVLGRGRVIQRDEQGRPLRACGTTLDINERKRAELRRIELEEHLRQSERMRAVGQLVGGVAHDFNNVLTTILGNVDMARAEAETRVADVAALRARLREIRESAELAADVVRQLLAFSRQQVAQPRPISLNDVIAGSERILRRLIPENVALIIDTASNLRGILADSGQIKQILLNLVVNARDAMPRGGTVTVATQNVVFGDAQSAARAGVQPGAYARLEIRDTGAGMDPETLRHAFEPFFTTKAMGLGTGLGLATVQGIVRQSGGYIGIESEPDAGTTFHIYFPAIDLPPEARPDLLRLEGAAPGGTETVLLCEDDLLVRPLVARMLKSAGYRVLTAENGESALEAAAGFEGVIHLLITDVVMPDMDGKELADALISKRPGIEVLYVSGYTSDVIAHHGVMDEGVHLLEKPFTSAELLCCVRRLLDRRHGASTAGDPVLLPCAWRGQPCIFRRWTAARNTLRYSERDLHRAGRY